MARYDGGYVRIWRKAILGDIGENPNRLAVFTYLVAIAQWHGGTTINWGGRPRKLEPGEALITFRELASWLECDHKTSRKYVEYLEMRGTLTTTRTPHGTLIKFNNWEKYQPQGPHDVHHDMDNGMDNGVPYTNTKIINTKKTNNKTNVQNDFGRLFDPFWEIYPRKDAKQVAIKAFRANIKKSDYEDLMKATSNYAKEIELGKTEKKFTKLPATWLRNEIWKDYIEWTPSTDGRVSSLEQVRAVLDLYEGGAHD